MNCVLCGNRVNFFSKRINEGYICKDCALLLPDMDLSEYPIGTIEQLCKENSEKKAVFETTESYGCLYIDSVHNMFCVSRKHSGDVPLEYGDIFFVYELAEVGLYCSDIRNIGVNSNKVICNVKLKILTRKAAYSTISKEYLIAGNELCVYKYAANHKLECSEPPKLTIFRNIFNQMIENELLGTYRKLQSIHEMRKMLEEEKGKLKKEI